MGIFKNMKIKAKLLSGFLLISVIAAAVGVFALVKMLDMDKRDTALYEENVIGIGAVADVANNYLNIRLNLRVVVSSLNNDAKISAINTAKEYIKNLKNHLETYEKTITEDEDREIFKSTIANLDKYLPVVDEIENSVKTGKSNDEIIKTVLPKYVDAGGAINNNIDKLLEFNKKQGKERAEINTKTAENAIMTMVILVIAAVIISIALGIALAQSISKPVNMLVAAGEKLAIGDINVDLHLDSNDEVGTLVKVFNKLVEATREQAEVIQKIAEGDMTVSIRIRSDEDIVSKKIDYMLSVNNNVFSEIRKAAEQVNSAAEQVAQGSTMLAQASTEQSATVEEISATVGNIASQSKENAGGARNANELASEARYSAENGSEQMKNMMLSMEEINEASRNISKIIKVIDDIAFQTNILALNAAVEAARAGSHGKGFAVVAEEVRNLAARSAKAANETTDLIESTIAKVNAGTKIANETANALEMINDKIGKVTGMIEEIATSSGEQATAVAQVNIGMNQIAGVIQTNSATAEESAAASEELSAQAEMLKTAVSRFKTRERLDSIDNGMKSSKGIKEAAVQYEDIGKFGKY